MTNRITQENINVITSIFKALYNRDMHSAESQLFSVVESIITQSKKEEFDIVESLNVLMILYSEFNTYYLSWLNTNKYDVVKERMELSSSEHNSYLISHCSDPASMDDLLFEAHTYLTDMQDPYQVQEVQSHLEHYRKMLAM